MSASIYVLQDTFGRVKLGISKRPESRSRHFGPEVTLVHQTDALEQASKIEKLAHRVLALHGKHVRGEWFEATIEDAIAAIDVAVRQAECAELALGGQLNGGNSEVRQELRELAENRRAEAMVRVRFLPPCERELAEILAKIKRDTVWLALACNVSVETAESWLAERWYDVPRSAVVLMRLLRERPELLQLIERSK